MSLSESPGTRSAEPYEEIHPLEAKSRRYARSASRLARTFIARRRNRLATRTTCAT